MDTLHCNDAWVSDAVLADLVDDPRISCRASGLQLHGPDGRLRPFEGG
jgi:hypothetical protein